jgi:hypothetical protein
MGLEIVESGANIRIIGHKYVARRTKYKKTAGVAKEGGLLWVGFL